MIANCTWTTLVARLKTVNYYPQPAGFAAFDSCLLEGIREPEIVVDRGVNQLGSQPER